MPNRLDELGCGEGEAEPARERLLRSADLAVAAHVAVASVLRDCQGLAQDGRRLLAALGGALGFTQGVLWLAGAEGLEARMWWAAGACDTPAPRFGGRHVPFGQGLVGAAFSRRLPVARTSDGDRAADRAGGATAVAFPVIGSGRVLAVIAFSGAERLELTDRLHAALVAIGHEIGWLLAPQAEKLRPSPLSARERQLLQLAAEGMSGPQIARRLSLSPATVKTHFENIYAKYGVPDRVAAVAKAMRDGLIS